MTYRPHVLIQFGGTLFDSETWSCGIRIHDGVVEDWDPSTINDNNESVLEDFFTDVAAYVSNADSGFSNEAVLTYVKANAIGPDGNYSQADRTVAYYAGPGDTVPGGAAATYAQLALVVSLRGDRDRGRASRGRYYIPAGSLGVDTNGRIPQAQCEASADAAATFLGNVNNFPGFDLPWGPSVHVMSALGTPGPVMKVDRVEVGNVMDTQRRRRNQLPETYSTAPVSP